ncbi:hypothetical protein NXH76_15005 [Blautia schinkii]|nr:hypothetical protein [Blautia schinkii]
MTKLKNTKKGMAKKALSISLVAAMLATSNVPVWAAEDIFSDNSAAVEAEAPVDDVDVFTEAPIENAAPAVEEAPAADDAIMQAIINEGDISVNLAADKKSVVWSSDAKKDQVIISGTITKGGEALPDGWMFRWVDSEGIVMDDVADADRKVDDVADMGVPFGSKAAGKTLTLHVYDVDDSNNQILYDIATDIKVSVEKRELKDFTFEETDKDYNGFAQTLETTIVTQVSDNKDEAIATNKGYYRISISSATNFGDVFNATVTADDSSPYTGTITKKVGKINKKNYVAGDIIASTDKNQTYQYTGNAIVIDNSKVALTESKSADKGADGKLNGANLSAAIKKATVTPGTGTAVPTPGDRTVTVSVDASKLDNINATDGTLETEETVKIKKRDLSTAGTRISVNTVSGQIPTSATVDDLDEYLSFTGVEGSALTLEAGDDYTFIVTDSKGNAVTEFSDGSTYNITVRANKDGKNCEKEQTIRVVATGATLKSVTYANAGTYKPFYTGAEIKPTKDDLGKLTLTYINNTGNTETTVIDTDAYEITGYSKNKDASTKYDEDANILNDAYVNIKITSGTYENKTCTVSFLIQPLEVQPGYLTVPADISFNKGYNKAEDYNVPVTVVAKDGNKKNDKTLSASDYTVAYEFVDAAGDKATNAINNLIKTTVTITNPNYILGTTDGKTKKVSVAAADWTKIVAKKLTDSMVVVNPSSYTYTGGKIEPNYAVMDGTMVLYKKGDVDAGKEEYEEVSITDAVDVGTATITVKGVPNKYSGTAKGTFSITPANTSSVKVNIEDQDYTGRQVRPRDFDATLNGNKVNDQFEIVSYGTNVEAGKGTVVLKPVDGNKNFTGSNITAEFNIVKEKIEADLTVYDSKGFNITAKYDLELDEDDAIGNNDATAFAFDGNAKTFAKAVLSNLTKENGGKTTATVSDLEIKYVDNISGKKVGNNKYNIGYIYAVAKDGTGFAGNDSIVTANGTVIKGVVAKLAFGIESVKFVKQNITVKSGTYAGGLPVKPQVLIQIGGNTLVEGQDYTVKLLGKDANGQIVAVTPTEVTVGQIYGVEVTGINGYAGSLESTVDDDAFTSWGRWGINKKNLNDCDVSVKDGVATVMNGYIPVPTTEYTVKDNGDKSYTVSANTTSKNYTGSKTVTGEGQKPEDKPVAPTIQQVNVVGNKATVILEGDTEGSTGYDYVISKSKVFSDKASRVGVNANVLSTQTTFRYVDQGVYYAYLHSWKRGADGKKIFSSWSNAYPFVVSSITPDQPTVTSVKVSGKKVTVTYTKTANATGYDLVLGSKTKKVYGEMRPVEYGKLVKKVTKGNVVTATFTNVPKGTYYAGLHAYNRTSENNGKVFSPWSNTKKVTVK